MRIGIDARWLHEGLTHCEEVEMVGGIGQYSLNLIPHLLKIDRKNQYIFFLNANRPIERFVRLISEFSNADIAFLPAMWRVWKTDEILGVFLRKLQEKIFVIHAVKRKNLDVFHSHSQLVPPYDLGSAKSVITVHDLIPSVFQREGILGNVAKFNWDIHLSSIRRADFMIAISENTKADIIKYVHVEPEKVKVIYYGLPQGLKPLNNQELIQKVLRKYKIQPPFFLYIGGLQPTKNARRLIEAFQLLRIKYCRDVRLVMAGVKSGFCRRGLKMIQSQIDKLDIVSSVILLKYLPKNELIPLYNAALALVHPSLYEGFGFPPLEAMACGTPVVVSNKSSIPEVVGDAGIYVNPYQPEDIARGMLKCIHNKQLWNQLREKGLRRARLFSWEHTAEQTLGVYNRVFKGSVLK